MIRNIPAAYTQRKLLRELLSAGFQGTLDFIYMHLSLLRAPSTCSRGKKRVLEKTFLKWVAHKIIYFLRVCTHKPYVKHKEYVQTFNYIHICVSEMFWFRVDQLYV